MEKTILNFHFDYLTPSLIVIVAVDQYLDPKPKFSGEGGVFLLSRKNLKRQQLNMLIIMK